MKHAPKHMMMALLVACAFSATTLTSYTAEAKTQHNHETSKKKKKKHKKNHQASVAKHESKADRAPASAGYQRASVYMSKHDEGTSSKRKHKKPKKHS